MTKIKECGTQTAIEKTDETESVSSPSGCSEKPVFAMQAKLANGKFRVFNVNRSVPRKPASSGRAGKPFEGLGQNLHKKPRVAFKGPQYTNVTILVSMSANSLRQMSQQDSVTRSTKRLAQSR